MAQTSVNISRIEGHYIKTLLNFEDKCKDIERRGVKSYDISDLNKLFGEIRSVAFLFQGTRDPNVKSLLMKYDFLSEEIWKKTVLIEAYSKDENK